MTRTLIAALLAAAALPATACSCSQKKPAETAATAAAAPRGKPEAPVDVEAALQDGAGRVTIRFSGLASGVDVKVWGVDGMEVTSAPAPIAGATYAAGDVATVDVAFRPGPGRSLLAVSVSGVFAGAKRTRIASFPVGKPTAAQEKARAGQVETGSDGQPVRLMP